jgi:flavodoxin
MFWILLKTFKSLPVKLKKVKKMRTLVIYYSRSGKTKFVASKLAEKLGADIEEVIDRKNRKGLIGFILAGRDATRGVKTEIEETRYSPKNYDLIALGTPIWNSRPTPAIRTYLAKNDLSGKKVALFCTLNGSDEAKAVEKIKDLVPNNVGVIAISKPLKNPELTDRRLSEWCKSLLA